MRNHMRLWSVGHALCGVAIIVCLLVAFTGIVSGFTVAILVIAAGFFLIDGHRLRQAKRQQEGRR